MSRLSLTLIALHHGPRPRTRIGSKHEIDSIHVKSKLLINRILNTDSTTFESIGSLGENAKTPRLKVHREDEDARGKSSICSVRSVESLRKRKSIVDTENKSNVAVQGGVGEPYNRYCILFDNFTDSVRQTSISDGVYKLDPI